MESVPGTGFRMRWGVRVGVGWMDGWSLVFLWADGEPEGTRTRRLGFIMPNDFYSFSAHGLGGEFQEFRW